MDHKQFNDFCDILARADRQHNFGLKKDWKRDDVNDFLREYVLPLKLQSLEEGIDTIIDVTGEDPRQYLLPKEIRALYKIYRDIIIHHEKTKSR